MFGHSSSSASAPFSSLYTGERVIGCKRGPEPQGREKEREGLEGRKVASGRAPLSRLQPTTNLNSDFIDNVSERAAEILRISYLLPALEFVRTGLPAHVAAV